MASARSVVYRATLVCPTPYRVNLSSFRGRDRLGWTAIRQALIIHSGRCRRDRDGPCGARVALKAMDGVMIKADSTGIPGGEDSQESESQESESQESSTDDLPLPLDGRRKPQLTMRENRFKLSSGSRLRALTVSVVPRSGRGSLPALKTADSRRFGFFYDATGTLVVRTRARCRANDFSRDTPAG